jgi:hypothetical protein
VDILCSFSEEDVGANLAGISPKHISPNIARQTIVDACSAISAFFLESRKSGQVTRV